MCTVPSWIKTTDAVLFLTDADARAHGIDYKDATGHTAIRNLWPGATGECDEGIGSHTPPVVIEAIKSGKMACLLAEGEIVVTDGEWELTINTIGGYVYVRKGATFTAPVLAEVGGSVDVWEGATFTAPVLAEVGGYVYVRKGATFTAPVLAEVGGSVYVRKGATFTAPKLR